MSDDFVLTDDDKRKLFRPPGRAMKCRQLVWSEAKAAEAPIAIADLVRDHPEFRSAEIYRAAHALVMHGVLTRKDISWGVIAKGKEITRYRCAVCYIEPFTENSSRKW